MFGLRALARPLAAGMFVYGGLDSVRGAESKSDAAEPFAKLLGDSVDPAMLVKVNGAVQVGAGAMLAFGIMPRLAATALAATLVPTTYAGHRFWEERDEGAKRMQTIQFLKNASMFGGLVHMALDTGGRPSIFWTARRSARHAADAIGEAAHKAGDALPG